MERLPDGEIVPDVLQRASDDNPQVALRIITSNDGDIHLAIIWIDDAGNVFVSPASRFCLSGTRSNNMLLAANELKKAMIKDCGLWTEEMETVEQIGRENKQMIKDFFGD